MTLTTRLSVFFLATLGVVLVGFSVALYLLVGTHLQRQAADRLDAVLNTLAAAAEVGEDGIEWEAHKRQLSMEPETEVGRIHWLVQDGQGNWVDGSRSGANEVMASWLAGTSFGRDHEVIDEAGGPWLVAHVRLTSGRPEVPVASGKALGGDGNAEKKYPALMIAACISLQSVQAMLRNLALALVAMSTVLWLVAALVGRSLCRRALRPVTRMAETSRTLSAANLDERLPVAANGDELTELGQAFNDLLARLQEAFERQRQFTGDASHQLRTPLTAMLGQVEVALRRERTVRDYRQALMQVQEQAEHLRQIVEMLLFLARADAEVKLPHLEVIDLARWLPEHLQSWSKSPRSADFRIEGSTGKEHRVEVQAPLLGQLLDNLINNACKYSQPGTAITLRLATEPGYVLLTVDDQGDGITPEDLPHIFEPFYRSAEARRTGRGGVGLGLAVARRIATAFRGSLAVESRVGRGSCFLLRLPEARAPHGEIACISLQVRQD